MSPAFPEVSVQNLIGSWWQTASKPSPARGRLVQTIVPYPDMKPWRAVPQGRGVNPRQHDRADYRLEEFRIGDPVQDVAVLPVAGMPLRTGESFLVRRGKARPAVVVAVEGVLVDPRFKRTAAKWQSNPTLLAAPYYGVASDGTRGGWNPEFVGRIQRAEYCQYVWDLLPIGGSDDGSILRLDHLFPIGADPSNWKLTRFELRGEALSILDEWLAWHLTGSLDPNGALHYARTVFQNL